MEQVFVGLDIGGTNTKYAVVDRAGQLVWKAIVPTPPSRPLDVDGLVSLIRRLTDTSGAVEGELLGGIGVAAPGRVDSVAGRVHEASNLLWRDVDLASPLRESFGVPVHVMNDTNAAAMGELLHVRRPAHSLACLTIGTGVGCGLVLGGELYEGPHHAAGEFGHIIVEPGGRRCVCGGQGCLETVAAGPAIVRAYREACPPSAATGETRLSEVVRAAKAGHTAALAALSAAEDALGIQIANTANLLDIQDFVVAGGVANIDWPFVGHIERAAKRYVLSSKRAQLVVRKSSLIDIASIYGALIRLLRDADLIEGWRL